MVSDDRILKDLAAVRLSDYASLRSALRSIKRVTGAKSIEDALCNNVGRTMSLIEAAYPNTGGRRSKVKAAIAALKACPEMKRRTKSLAEWRVLQTEYDDILRSDGEDNVASAEELANMAPLSDVAEAAAALTHSSYRESKHKVILTISAHVWPKRADWSVRIVKPGDARGARENVLELSPRKAKLVLARYKTSRHYGSYEEELPALVADVIRESVRRHPRIYLLQKDRTEAPMTRQQISEQYPNIFMQYVGKRIGVNLLRHMWISQRIDYNRMTIAETNAIAAKMLHSPAEQRKYYRVGAQFLAQHDQMAGT